MESAFDILNASVDGEVQEVIDAIPVRASAAELLGMSTAYDILGAANDDEEEADPDPVIIPGNPHELHFDTQGDFQVGAEEAPPAEEEEDPDPVIERGNPHELRFVTQGDFNTQEDSPIEVFNRAGEGKVWSESIPADMEFELALLAHADPIEPEPGEQVVVGDHGDEDDLVGAQQMLRKAPPFAEYEAKRAAGNTPVLRYDEVPARLRQWTLDFGPVSAPAGFSTTITISPQCLFRGEKIIATDTAAVAGTGTRITTVAVGARIQRPLGNAGSLSLFFSQTALANGITFDTAKPWSRIAVTVSFVTACTFDMTVFGTAVL